MERFTERMRNNRLYDFDDSSYDCVLGFRNNVDSKIIWLSTAEKLYPKLPHKLL